MQEGAVSHCEMISSAGGLALLASYWLFCGGVGCLLCIVSAGLNTSGGRLPLSLIKLAASISGGCGGTGLDYLVLVDEKEVVFLSFFLS